MNEAQYLAWEKTLKEGDEVLARWTSGGTSGGLLYEVPAKILSYNKKSKMYAVALTEPTETPGGGEYPIGYKTMIPSYAVKTMWSNDFGIFPLHHGSEGYVEEAEEDPGYMKPLPPQTDMQNIMKKMLQAQQDNLQAMLGSVPQGVSQDIVEMVEDKLAETQGYMDESVAGPKPVILSNKRYLFYLDPDHQQPYTFVKDGKTVQVGTNSDTSAKKVLLNYSKRFGKTLFMWENLRENPTRAQVILKDRGCLGHKEAKHVAKSLMRSISNLKRDKQVRGSTLNAIEYLLKKAIQPETSKKSGRSYPSPEDRYNFISQAQELMKPLYAKGPGTRIINFKKRRESEIDPRLGHIYGPEYSSLAARNPDWEDHLPGGLADDKIPSNFEQTQLRKGIKVELEHTGDKLLATEIAMDHLTEDPRYYDKLEKMEQGSHYLARNPCECFGECNCPSEPLTCANCGGVCPDEPFSDMTGYCSDWCFSEAENQRNPSDWDTLDDDFDLDIYRY